MSESFTIDDLEKLDVQTTQIEISIFMSLNLCPSYLQLQMPKSIDSN